MKVFDVVVHKASNQKMIYTESGYFGELQHKYYWCRYFNKITCRYEYEKFLKGELKVFRKRTKKI